VGLGVLSLFYIRFWDGMGLDGMEKKGFVTVFRGVVYLFFNWGLGVCGHVYVD